MDDFNNFSCDEGYSYSPSYCAPVADSFTESYNYCTTDPIAIMLRQHRWLQAELPDSWQRFGFRHKRLCKLAVLPGYQDTAAVLGSLQELVC
jgi:hypothetical protein